MARDLGCRAWILAGICSVRAATLAVRPRPDLAICWLQWFAEVPAVTLGVIDCVAVHAAWPDRDLGYVGARRLGTLAVPQEVGDRDALQLGDLAELGTPLEACSGGAQHDHAAVAGQQLAVRTALSLCRSRTCSMTARWKQRSPTSRPTWPASSLTAEEMGLVTSAPCPGRPSRVSGLPLPHRFGSYRGRPKEPCARTEHAASAEAILVPVVCPSKNPPGTTTGAPARPMRDPRIEAHGYDMQTVKNPDGYDQAHSLSVRPGYEQSDALQYPKACSAQGPPEPAPGPDFLGQSQYSCPPYEVGDPQ
jgi:hypothetical protein